MASVAKATFAPSSLVSKGKRKENYLMVKRALALLVLVVVPAVAKHRWVTCKILFQSITTENQGNATVGLASGIKNSGGAIANGAIYSGPIYRTFNTVDIENAGGKLTIQEILKPGQTPLALPVHGIAQCYQEKNLLVFEDGGGKKHKFQIIHIEMKQ